jgi:hypothetical protein
MAGWNSVAFTFVLLGAPLAASESAQAAPDVPVTGKTDTVVSLTTLVDLYERMTGLTYVGAEVPRVTIAFETTHRGRWDTPEEFADSLNEILADRNLMLIHRKATFTLIHVGRADGGPALVSREDLACCAKKEVIRMMVPLKNLKAADVAPRIMNLLGLNGDCTIIESGNELLLLDSVGNIRRILKELDRLEKAANR